MENVSGFSSRDACVKYANIKKTGLDETQPLRAISVPRDSESSTPAVRHLVEVLL